MDNEQLETDLMLHHITNMKGYKEMDALQQAEFSNEKFPIESYITTRNGPGIGLMLRNRVMVMVMVWRVGKRSVELWTPS
jgi:hypothetical protein